MKNYTVIVDASPRYSMAQTYRLKASSWGGAIGKAVRQYFKEHKHLHTDYCLIRAWKIKEIKEEGQE